MDDKHIDQMRNRRALERYTTRAAREIDSATTDAQVEGEHAMENVREAEHNGHSIVVRTRYEIEVDRKPVMLPVMVDNFGRVACHALPNYSFLSAIDLVKQLIDTFPEDFHGEHRAPAHRRRAAEPRGARGKKSRTAKQRPAGRARVQRRKRESATAKK
jgi:hypothetical protein